MKKSILLLLILCFVAFGSGPALAVTGYYYNNGSGFVWYGADPPGNNDHWTYLGDGGGNGNPGEIINTNTNTNNNANFNTNFNSNNNSNQNTNTNVNSNRQAQGQIQGQAQIQGQKQGQFIKDSANNQAFNNQNILFEDKRELPVNPTYQAPQMGQHRGPYEKGIFHMLTPWLDKSTWTMEDFDAMPGGGKVTMSDSNCAESQGFTLTDPSYKIKEGQSSFYILIEGEKGDTPLHIWGRLGAKALKAGATQVKILGVAYTFATAGSGWNIGLGGGFNAVNNGKDDNYGGSVGGGTGYGQFNTAPVEKMSMAVRCYGTKE